jgi:hypothetical protein
MERRMQSRRDWKLKIAVWEVVVSIYGWRIWDGVARMLTILAGLHDD